MEEDQALHLIDLSINAFINSSDIDQSITLSTAPKTDWLSLKYRRLSWQENDIDYLIEIFPSIDEKE